MFLGRKQSWRLSAGISDPRFAVKDGGRGFENEVSGACSQPSAQLDRFFSTELTNLLFANSKVVGKARGVSCASVNESTSWQCQK